MQEDLVPRIARIDETRQETPDIRTLRLTVEDPAFKNSFRFAPGQFCLVSVLGTGEAAFCIASPPAWKDFIEISVKEVGKVSSALHDLEVGDRVGLRGPYGNTFPYDTGFGRNIVFVGGGIGLAPLRPLIWQTLGDRRKFKDIYIIYGAKTEQDLVYKRDLKTWTERDDVTMVTAVDPGGDAEDWKGEVGLVPQILEKVGPPVDSLLVTCGPPIMVKYVFVSALKMGFRPADVITTLEMKMTCGVGTCGRCNIGSRYVCRDGPVFTLEQIQALPDEF